MILPDLNTESILVCGNLEKRSLKIKISTVFGYVRKIRLQSSDLRNDKMLKLIFTNFYFRRLWDTVQDLEPVSGYLE